MQIKVLKLGTVCKDRATQLEGTLTHWVFDMDQRVEYIFQPRGLNEHGAPLDRLLFGLARLEVKDTDFEVVDIPFEILGSQVTDKASGFTGMAVEFIRHINGCFHVVIQPAGVVEKTKAPIRKHEFDLRQCAGEKIKVMTESELAQSKVDKPSPDGDLPRKDVPGCIRVDTI